MPTNFQKARRRVKTASGWSDPISYATSSESVELTDGTDLQTKINSLGTASTKDVPASGNASTTQVVMGNDSRLSDSRPASDVSAWAKASTKPTYTASEVGAIATTAKGSVNGVAELDSNGKVPSSQLPSFVDDTIEGYLYNSKWYSDSSHTTEIAGETGKIYVELSTNKTYRWSGSAFVEISESLALGETSSTAYRGDRGKTAYDHSQSTHARTDATKTEASSTNGNIKINGTETTVYTHPGSGTNPHGTTASDVGLGNVGNFKAVSTVASQGLSSTEQSNARANIGAGTSNLTIGTTASTAAAGNHTHTTSIATSTGTNQITLAANTKYAITAGGTNYIFTTPPDTNTWRGIQNNLTSDSTTDSLSAAQGKALKTLVDGKAASSHTHNYAGSSSAGGAATSANKINTNAGSATQPVYFSGGVPVATTYSLAKSVPSNAVFTDTTYNFSGTSFTSNNSTGVNADNVTYNAHTYYASGGPATSLGASTNDGALYSQAYSTSWVGQIAQDYRNGRLFVRGKNNGTWQSWKRIAQTGESQPASDVYSWAKASTKPSYTGKEITPDVVELFVSSTGVTTAVTKTFASTDTTPSYRWRYLHITYGYQAASTVNMYIQIPNIKFTENWQTQTRLIFHQLSPSNPIMQIIGENVTISYTTSTRTFQIARGSKMYYSSLNSSGSSAGSNDTSIVIYKVLLIN